MGVSLSRHVDCRHEVGAVTPEVIVADLTPRRLVIQDFIQEMERHEPTSGDTRWTSEQQIRPSPWTWCSDDHHVIFGCLF